VSAPVTLRPPAAVDVDALLALVYACDLSYRDIAPDGWEPPPAGSARWVSQLGRRGEWARVAVGEREAVVGFVTWEPAGTGPGRAPLPGMAHLGALFVDPGHWRRGIGARLLEAALDAMRDARYARARLMTVEGAPAEAFYRAQGWRRDGRRSFHQLLGLTVVGYGRKL
jgi:GNAT superfamily N-acetyltransferase